MYGLPGASLPKWPLDMHCFLVMSIGHWLPTVQNLSTSGHTGERADLTLNCLPHYNAEFPKWHPQPITDFVDLSSFGSNHAADLLEQLHWSSCCSMTLNGS
eukprot:162333_1